MGSPALRAVYVAVLIVLSLGLLTVSFRRDRYLAWLVAVGLLVYTVGGLAFGRYLHEVRGRDYFAPDEQAFQAEGSRILSEWRRGHSYAASIAGHWPHVNAAVMALWGPSITPMRLLNGLAAAASIAATYVL